VVIVGAVLVVVLDTVGFGGLVGAYREVLVWDGVFFRVFSSDGAWFWGVLRNSFFFVSVGGASLGRKRWIVDGVENNLKIESVCHRFADVICMPSLWVDGSGG
jgi:hypothetical protein